MITCHEGQIVELVKHDEAVAVRLMFGRYNDGTVRWDVFVTCDVNLDANNHPHPPAHQLGVMPQATHQERPARNEAKNHTNDGIKRRCDVEEEIEKRRANHGAGLAGVFVLVQLCDSLSSLCKADEQPLCSSKR